MNAAETRLRPETPPSSSPGPAAVEERDATSLPRACSHEHRTACASGFSERALSAPVPAPAPETLASEALAEPAVPAPGPRPYKLHRRFDRTARLLGDAGMQRLARAHVAVFGMGGVGSYAVEALVRSGVGELTLVDFDSVCVTNSNRQLHATVSTVGRSKAELMASRCKQVNPDVRVNVHAEFYREELAERLFPAGRYDFVIDAIDNVKAKLHLLHRCLTLGVPVVSSMGAAGRLDPTRIRVDDLSETQMDPFAKDIRKLLRKKYGVSSDGPTGITAVYSVEPRLEPVPLAYDAAHQGFLCVCPHKENEFHTCDHRTQIDGSVAFVTSVFGMNAAGAVVRRLAQG